MNHPLPPLPALPALDALPALQLALREHGAAVLGAPPGSGKTTLIPLALLDEPWLAGRRILMLEPRRVAARASARRMAALCGEAVGQTVGYQVRFERRVSAATRIEVITEGLLTRRLQADPELPGVGLVIFDEFHERSLDADLALALTLDARSALCPELRLLVMSATLDAEAVSTLLGDAPQVSASGRQFPVAVHYRPPPGGEAVEDALARVARQALADHEGDVLAFLPGAREIRACQRRLETRLAPGVDVLPLYGELPSDAQDAALAPAQPGRRKLILATNIAQTSLTIEGVSTVVDAGLVRVARHDLASGASRLDTERVSQASAEQRSGRAGRLGPGQAYRLWSAEQQRRLAPQDTPEIVAADLSRLALELAAWGELDPARLRFIDLPPPAAWKAAIELLEALGAIDAQRRLTAHGRALQSLPLDPRRGQLLLGARAVGELPTAAWCAALLDERSAGPLDLEERVTAAARGRGDPAQQRRLGDAVRQLLRQAGDGGEPGAVNGDAVGRLLALAWPERIARRRAGGAGVYLCADGGEARLPETDPLAHSEWLAIAHWEPGPPRRVRAAAALSEAELRSDHAARLQWSDHVAWDAQQQAVIAEQRQALGALVLARRPLRDAPERQRSAMLAGIRALGLDALPWDERTRQLQARIESLRLWSPGEPWPASDDASLATTLEDWLAPWLDGITRREQLARVALADALAARLEPAQRQALARRAPTHLAVPSGSQVVLEYAPDGAAPVLAVKLQELFGLSHTPAVDQGRMPVMLHLLSPARRPIQVTRDLAGFWARTYAEVRKELKGRYPRHPWPDDPLSAPPTARVKPRS